MKNRPLCCICLAVAVLIGSLTIGAGGKFVKELRPSPLEQGADEGDWLSVRGRVYQKEEKEKYQILYLKNCSIYIQKDQKNQKSLIQESRILIYDEKKQKVHIGNEVKAEGPVQFFEAARNPGNFDQKAYYQRQDIHGKVWSESCKITDSKIDRQKDELEKFRKKWKSVLIEEAGEKKGSILSAMILGEKSQMDTETKKLYQVNGIGHILAISGLHLSIIGIGIYYMIRRLTGSYVIGGIGGIFFFTMYVLMIGFTVSVIRAGIMYLFRVGADMTGRHYDSVTALAVAAMTVLIWRPLSIYDGAFWLSFLAVTAAIFQEPQSLKEAQDFSGNAKKKFVYKIKENIKSNIEMQMFLLPVVLYYFYEFPLYSVWLNLFVVPLMSVLLSLGMAGSLGCMTFTGTGRITGRWMLKLCGWILDLYEILCERMLNLPGARIVTGKPAVWKILFYYICLMAVYFLWRHKKENKRKGKWAFVLAGLLVLLYHPVRQADMQVTVLDVGQGDGIFIRGPQGGTYMIDGGSSDIRQVGQYRIEPYLLSKGVGKLDYVFLSHGDNDHKNGIEEMLGRQKTGVKIGTLVLPQESVWDESMRALVETARKNHVRVAVIKQGECLTEKGMKIQCLAPDKNYSAEKGNAASMVLAVSYKEFDFLFTGDVEGEGEEALCEALKTYCPKKSFEVLKAAHHGSKNSSSEQFLDLVRPEYTMISAGVDNSYGHPHAETLKRLLENGSRIWNTANCGGIEITVEFGGKIQYTLKEGSEITAYEESE